MMSSFASFRARAPCADAGIRTPNVPRKIPLANYGGFGENAPEGAESMKSIIVYTRQVKAQNLYPKRIISPPSPNKCCAVRMEVLGRPRIDEHGRRFIYKRCRVCGFAVRHFLDATPSIIAQPTMDPKARKPAPMKERTVPIQIHPPVRRPQPAPRKPAPSRHVPRKPARRPHGGQVARKTASRRRR